MSLREPAWRTPSRPCPFYQRGNCIFAAKCNFLHTLPQNKAGVEQDVKTLHKHKESLDFDDRPPILRVDSPASIRSPPREPQMQRLLSALTEVIGDEDEEGQEALTEQDDPGAWPSGLPTLVHGADATFFARVNDTMAELMQMTDGEEPTNDEEDEDDISEPVDNELGDSIQHIPSSSAPEDLPEPPSIHTTPTSPDAQYVEIPPPPLPENHDDLLSPVEMSALLLNNFSLEEDTFSIDSGFEETWKPPTVFASTFDLLRSPFGSPSNRILSPRIGALPAPSSPLRQTEQSSTLADDLDSPSNRISAPVVVENRESPLSECEPTPVNRSSLAYMLSPEPIPVEDGVGDSDPDSSDISESYGHTSVWEPTDLETSIYIGASNEGLVAAKAVEALERQDTESTGNQLVEEGVSAGDDEKVRTSKRDTKSSDGLHEEVTESIPSPLVTAQAVEVAEPQEVESEGEETQAEGTGIDVEGEAVEDRDVQDNSVDLDKTPSQPSEHLHKSADLDKTPSLPRDERLETPTFDIASSVQEVPWSALSPSQDAQEVDDVVDACIDLDKTPSQPREGQLQTSTQDIVPSVLNEYVDFSNSSPPRGEHLEAAIHDIVPSALDTYMDHRTSSPPREELQTSMRDIIPLDDLIESIEHSTPSPSLDDQIQHSVPSPFMDAEEVEEGDDMPLGLDSSLSLPQEVEEDQSLEAALPLPNEVEVVNGMSLERTLSLPQGVEAVEGSSDTTPSLWEDAEAIVGRTMEEDRTLSLSQEEWAEEKFPESSLTNGDMPHPSTLSKADDIPVPGEPPISTSPEPVADSPAPQPAYASEDDSISFLDYLQPEVEQPVQDGDTLNSLYDVYTDIDETASPIQQSPAASLRLHSPIESTRPLRERVFTPPPSASPVRSQAFSSPSSSPVTSTDSASKGRVSPASVASSSKTSHHNGGEDMESQESSKKVPFGFRPQSHPARPSLVLNQGRSLSRLGRSPIDDDKPLTPPPSSACSTGALRPLRLSVLLNNQTNSIQSLPNANNYPQPHSATASLSSVPSRNSSLASHSLPSGPATANPYRSSTSSSHIIDSTLRPLRSPSLLTDDLQHLATFGSPISAPAAAHPHPSWPSALHDIRSASRLSEPIYEQEHEGENNENADLDDTYRRKDSRDEPIRRSILESPHRHHHQSPNPYSRRSSHVPHQPRTAPGSRSESIAREPLHSIATPKPTLMFAIASDDVSEVRRVLESGDANPNDTVGPQSALQFALTNDQLTNKLNIVKTLLAFGADPSHLKGLPGGANGSRSGSRAGNLQDGREEGSAGGGSAAEAGAQQALAKTLMDEMDPATRYFVKRADAAHTRKTSKLIHRSFFRPLTRVRYDLVGQDRALEELFKLLSIHSRQISVTPVVVMFSGPSGHGKSLLARKFGSLLDVPTHTVNMVTVRSQDDLWESYSINIHEEPTNCTLAEFLVNNEGKRCVVVLDEIEKVDNEKVLWSLLMPWESGRCSFEAKSRHVDTRNVIWLCTSNIGQDLVFNHWAARENQEEMLSREEFLELVALLRPTVSERLGASVLSRMTSVLPFVPFTPDEKRALCAEAIYQLGGEDAQALSRDTVDELIESSLGQYIPEEGARSLHRAVSNQLVDVI